MIYCVEDDTSIRELMLYALRASGFEAEGFCEGQALFAALAHTEPQLILLDIMLPGMDGIEILKNLRGNPATAHISVIIASAKGTEYDKVVGLDLGADDYLVKPFLPLELVTRVKALFRRVEAFSAQEEEAKDNMEFGDICMYPKRRVATLSGNEFALTPLEFDFLCHMLEHPEHAASKDDLLKTLWKVDSREVDTRAVDDMVKRLRKKLKEQGSSVKIETVWGYGFRLTVGGEA